MSMIEKGMIEETAMGSLDGSTVIITGAARGLGAAFAEAVARQGGKVCICDVRPPEAAVAAIQGAGGEAMGARCDVTDAGSVARFVAEAAERFGTVHGLVNNAALFADTEKARVDEFSSDDFDRVMAVNVRGAFEMVKAVLPHMKRQGYGKIVNIASGTVFKGTPMMLPYVTSKGALLAMTRALARELGGDGIRVNCLAPGLTMSEGLKEHPGWIRDGEATVASRCLKREQVPEDLVGAVEFLLSKASDFMTGQTMVVDGGSVMP